MEIIKENLTLEQANQLEIELIKKYKENGITLYNMTAGGEGTPNHKPIFTKEWRKKLSDAKSGDKWIGEKNSFYGKHHSKETKEKISRIHKGKRLGADNPFYGKTHTNEHKKMFSELAKKTFSGKPKSEEQKKKMSEAAKGRKHSLEQIEKNRLKSCIPYKVKIHNTEEEFIWLRGSIELSKFILKTYDIKISPTSLKMTEKKKYPIKGVSITQFQSDI